MITVVLPCQENLYTDKGSSKSNYQTMLPIRNSYIKQQGNLQVQYAMQGADTCIHQPGVTGGWRCCSRNI